MGPREASHLLRSFERDQGVEMVGLAGHAALPVVLNAEALHLLRINYFLDPPHVLPYEAEASLLLSSLCTEIDDGLFVIAPELRDLLLKRLVADFGSARVRDVARLLWEFSEKRTPWGDSPGLTEAQQLTALNFIDPLRALRWLERARSGEGSLPVSDERWFVVLEKDLRGRAAAIEEAEPTAIFAGSKLPALTELLDALMANFRELASALKIADALHINLSEGSNSHGAAGVWQAVLDVAWISNRMPEFLLAVWNLGTSPAWGNAIHEYWYRLSVALRVDQGRFEEPPPEWQILEQQRALIEKAIRACVVLVYEKPSNEPQIVGFGPFVGDYAVLTHRAGLPPVPSKEGRFFAESALEHETLTYKPGLPRFELTLAGIDEKTGLAVLMPKPGSSRAGLPEPLNAASSLVGDPKGRKVCVTGYPSLDGRNVREVLGRIMKETFGLLRLQPGEILEQRADEALLIHNCYTSGGNGGSPLIDIQSGLVLGIHFAAEFVDSPEGFKKGRAIATYRLADSPLLIEAGVFRSPQPVVPPPPEPALFINRQREQATFRYMLDHRSQRVLFVEGVGGIGKTALLRRFAELATERGYAVAFIDARDLGSSPLEYLAGFLWSLVPGPPVRPDMDFSSLTAVLRSQPTVIFFDSAERADDAVFNFLVRLVMVSESSLLVIASRGLRSQISDFSNLSVLRLGPLSRVDVYEWVKSALLIPTPAIADAVMSATGGRPNLLSLMIDNLRASPPSRAIGPIPTVNVTPPLDTSAIFYRDNPNESHGPYVTTRGQHTLFLGPYQIGTFPVTNQLFTQFISDGGYRHDEFWPGVDPSTRAQFITQDKSPGPSTWASATHALEFSNHPVAGVSFYEAQAFVNWLNRVLPPTLGMPWCLPTEDMWEYAVRGPEGFQYPWGPDWAAQRCNSTEAGINTTSAVDRFPVGRSFCGAYDMAGNVWEFVRAENQEPWSCVLRGGSFTNNADIVKSTLRLFNVSRDHRPWDFGFRCAQEPAPIPPNEQPQ